MDVGNRNHWRAELVVPSTRAAGADRRALAAARRCRPDYRGEVAERYAFDDGQGEVGFISSVTQPFCGDCSRARLSSDGVLYTCLFATHGTSLRDALRGGASDDAAARASSATPGCSAPIATANSASACAPAGTRAAQGRDVLHRRLTWQPSARLTHLDARQPPAMVDVGAKEVTRRTPWPKRACGCRASVAARTARQRPPHQEGPGVRHRHHRRRAWPPSARTS